MDAFLLTFQSLVCEEESVSLPDVPELATNDARERFANKATIHRFLSQTSSVEVNIS